MITDRTYYADGTERKRVEYLPRAVARADLARILRGVRHNLNVCIVRDKVEGTSLHRHYFLTNCMGGMTFERTISIE